jgi:hypothetical protein
MIYHAAAGFAVDRPEGDGRAQGVRLFNIIPIITDGPQMAFGSRGNYWAALIMCIMLFSFGAVPSTARRAGQAKGGKDRDK